MSKTRSLEIAQLVARALPAERPLVVALADLERAPRLRVGAEIDGHRIGLAVEQDGRRLAVIVGRTEAGRTAADKDTDEALGRAGWPVYRVTPDRVATRPMQAVADVLAALRERGAVVPARVPAKRREPVERAPVEALRGLCGEFGKTVMR